MTTALFLTLAACVLLAAIFWIRWRRRLVSEARRLPCPASGQDVDCVLLREPGSPHWVDVASCTGRSRPGTQCHNACIEVLNLGIDLHAIQDPTDEEDAV